MQNLCCACNKYQSTNTVRLQQTQIKKHNLFSNHQTTLPPQATIKQARFYKPCAYDKKLGFNKPAVVI
jgi:hypothetical protein